MIIATAVTGVAYILIILAVTGVVAGLSQYQSGGDVYVDGDDDRGDIDAVENWEE